MSTSPTSAPFISVIVPVRNGAKTIGVQLVALAAQRCDRPWEVVVVDNGSTDTTVEVVGAVEPPPPNLRIVEASGRVGVNHARNVGAGAARGDLLLFCDADDAVAPGWLQAMSDASDPGALLTGPLDRGPLNPDLGGDERPTVTTEPRPWPGFLAFASGANLGIDRSLLAELGGFDESYRNGNDDTVLSWRAQLGGRELRFVEGAVVRYRERDRLADVFAQFYRYGREDVHLYEDFRDRGMPRPTGRQALRAWGHLVVLAPRYLRSRPGRRQWVRSVARRLGRVAGSLRRRVRYL